MNTLISETAPIRNVEILINEAISLGMRVVHRPEPALNNVVKLWDEADTRRTQMCTSPEAA